MRIIQRFKDNFSYFQQETYVVTPHQNNDGERGLMRGNNEFLMDKKGEISINFSCYPILSEALGNQIFWAIMASSSRYTKILWGLQDKFLSLVI